MTEVIPLFSLIGDFAEDKDQAAAIRQSSIKPSLARGEKVVLDFTEVSLATQSFVHALISGVLRDEGDKALDLLEFKGCVPGVRGIIETVVQYSLETTDDDLN
jgi:hypothetical protein